MTVTPAAFAQTSEKINVPHDISVATTSSVPQELVGMDAFLSKTVTGTIQLDVNGALAAGYQKNLVYGVRDHLEKINAQVLAGKMTVNENFTAYSIDSSQTLALTDNVVFEKGLGYTGVRTEWYGDTYIHFHKKEAPYLYQSFYNTAGKCADAINFLSELSGDMDMTMQPDAQYAQSALDLLTVGAGAIGLTAFINSTFIKNAMAENKGIIWVIHNDFNSGTIGWAFDAQNW